MSSPKSLRRASNESGRINRATAAISSPMADTAEHNSFSDVSVRSDCDQVRNTGTITGLDTFTTQATYRTTELEKPRPGAPLFDAQHPDFVQAYGEPSEVPIVLNSTLTWEPFAEVYEVISHGRQPGFEKHCERVVPNPWRRFGTLTKLAVIGGWSTKRNQNSVTEVKAGSAPPRVPNAPQMALHRDPQHPFAFQYPGKGVPSDVAAHHLAIQVGARAENSWVNEPWFNEKRIRNFNSILSRFQIPQQAPAQTAGSRTKVRKREPSTSSTCSTAVSGKFSTASTAVSGRFSTASSSTSASSARKAKKN